MFFLSISSNSSDFLSCMLAAAQEMVLDLLASVPEEIVHEHIMMTYILDN